VPSYFLEVLNVVFFRPYSLSDSEQEKIYSIHRELATNYGVYYLSYFCEVNAFKIRIYHTSNPDWQEEYIKNDLIKSCHLYKAASHLINVSKNPRRIILPWETVPPISSLQKEIYLLRCEKGVAANGISFCHKTSSMTEFIAVAPEHKDKNFLLRLSNHIPEFRRYLVALRYSMKEFIGDIALSTLPKINR